MSNFTHINRLQDLSLQKMSYYKAIQLKTVMLITVFSLNIIVGFVCSIGVDMGFNAYHHEEDAIKMHVHADGKKHHHDKREAQHTDNAKKDDCCNDKILKISQTEKAVPQTSKHISPVFFTAFVAIYSNINITYAAQANTPNKYFVLGHHPPIPDIRIGIQSFQI